MSRIYLRVTTVLVISSSFFMMVLLFSVGGALFSVIEKWGSEFQITAYLNEGSGEPELKEIDTLLSKHPSFKHQLISQNNAINEFKSNSIGIGNELFEQEDLLSVIQARVDIKAESTLLGSIDSNKVNMLLHDLQQSGLVDEISSGQEWMKKYSFMVRSAKVFGLGILIGLSMTMLLVVGNTIRTSIADQKEKIEILELLGAKAWMIYKPFVVEGVLITSISMLIAVAATQLSTTLVKDHMSTLFSVWGISGALNTLSFAESLGLFLLAVLIGAIGSIASVRGMHTGWSASQRVSR